MGNIIHRIFGKKNARVIVLGLDGAGKTSMLYKVTHGHKIETLPTFGTNLPN